MDHNVPLALNLFLSPLQVNATIAPGIVVLKSSWSRQVVRPRPVERPAYDDLQRPPSGLQRPQPQSPFPSTGRLPYYYLYSLEIRNVGSKPIKAIAWNLTLSDPKSNEELGRHQFTSYWRKDSSGRRVTFRASSVSPPSKVVTIEGLEQGPNSPYLERVQINCLLYRDGSSWEHPDARENNCENLRKQEKLERLRRMYSRNSKRTEGLHC